MTNVQENSLCTGMAIFPFCPCIALCGPTMKVATFVMSEVLSSGTFATAVALGHLEIHQALVSGRRCCSRLQPLHSPLDLSLLAPASQNLKFDTRQSLHSKSQEG